MTHADIPATDSTTKTVLIVDDQEDERAIQQAMLRHHGYAVVEAATGEAGLEAAREAPPSVVLLDVAMPGMDGFAVCRALREDPRTAEVPIIIFTASVVAELREQARRAGADDVLEKPIDPRAVVARVEGMIGRP